MTENPTTAEQKPVDNGGSAVSGNRHSRRHSSHSSSGRSSRKIFKLRVAVGLLSVVLAIAIFGWIMVSMKLGRTEEQFLEYQLSTRQEVSDSEDRTAELERLRVENEELVKGMIPGLRLLEYDSTVAVDDQYVRNIGFTLTGTSYNKNYEYRIVLHNDSLNVVAPAVTLFLFDSRGIQVGTTLLTKKDATSAVEFSSLQPNETRSYTGSVTLNIQSEPKYFLIDVQ